MSDNATVVTNENVPLVEEQLDSLLKTAPNNSLDNPAQNKLSRISALVSDEAKYKLPREEIKNKNREERPDVPPVFNDEQEEKSYRELLEALAEWYPKAPRLAGNHAVLAKLEKTLPVLYGAMSEELPVELPDGTKPTALPKREGDIFIHQGADFTWENNPDGESKTYRDGDELPIHPFRGARSEDGLPDEFLKLYWKPWLEADLLSQKELGGGASEKDALDKQLHTSWRVRARVDDDAKALLPTGHELKWKQAQKELGADPDPERLMKYALQASRRI